MYDDKELNIRLLDNLDDNIDIEFNVIVQGNKGKS
jgi:hypothetical protein